MPLIKFETKKDQGAYLLVTSGEVGWFRNGAFGVSNQLIRNCLEKYLAAPEEEPTAWEVGKHLFGCYDSGRRDLSVRVKEVARERIHGNRARNTRA
jgi:hypothetical protein